MGTDRMVAAHIMEVVVSTVAGHITAAVVSIWADPIMVVVGSMSVAVPAEVGSAAAVFMVADSTEADRTGLAAVLIAVVARISGRNAVSAAAVSAAPVPGALAGAIPGPAEGPRVSREAPASPHQLPASIPRMAVPRPAYLAVNISEGTSGVGSRSEFAASLRRGACEARRPISVTPAGTALAIASADPSLLHGMPQVPRSGAAEARDSEARASGGGTDSAAEGAVSVGREAAPGGAAVDLVGVKAAPGGAAVDWVGAKAAPDGAAVDFVGVKAAPGGAAMDSVGRKAATVGATAGTVGAKVGSAAGVPRTVAMHFHSSQICSA